MCSAVRVVSEALEKPVREAPQLFLEVCLYYGQRHTCSFAYFYRQNDTFASVVDNVTHLWVLPTQLAAAPVAPPRVILTSPI